MGSARQPYSRITRSSWLGLTVCVLVAAFAMQWFERASSARSGDTAARLARPGDIRMIASVDCVYCAAATRWFDTNHVPFISCEIERDAACAEAYAALRAPGTPTILVRGRRLVGFDAAAILEALRDVPPNGAPAASPQ